MLGQFVRGERRPRLTRSTARVLGLAGFSAGLWLLGQGVASAEVTPQPAAPPVVSAPAQALLDTAGTLREPATEAVAPVVASVGIVSAPVVEVVEHVAPPVAAAVVAPVVSAVDDVLAPAVDPVLVRVDQLLEPLSPVLDPLSPVLDPLSPVGPAADADATAQPVVQPASDGPGAAASPSAVPTSPTGAVVSASIADSGRTGDERPMTPAAPTPHPALPAGSPTVAGGSSPSSNDQPPADLAAAVLAAAAAALAAMADDACDAAGNVAFDPSFSPD